MRSGSITLEGAYDHTTVVDSTLTVPVKTTAQRNSIASPALGMVIANSDTNQLEMYNGTGWEPVVSSNVVCRYNTAAQNLANSPSFTSLQWGGLVRQDSIYSYNAGNGEVTVNDDGWFEVTADISIDHASGNIRSGSFAALFNNGIQVTGTGTYGYHRITAQSHQTQSLTFLVNITSGDILSVRAQRFSGTATLRTLVNSCRLNIRRV